MAYVADSDGSVCKANEKQTQSFLHLDLALNTYMHPDGRLLSMRDPEIVISQSLKTIFVNYRDHPFDSMKDSMMQGLPQTKETRWFPVPSSLESGQVSPACVEYFEEVSGQIWTAKA
ncbi:hypothetical protein V6N13_011614 [Hibiscus sabdariffa]